MRLKVNVPPPSLEQIKNYLKKHNWKIDNEYKNERTWDIYKKKDYYVYPPYNPKFLDYDLRAQELIETLAAEEKRSEMEIYKEMTNE